MHKLNRTSVPRPACLDDYDPVRHSWEDLTGLSKKIVRLSLQRMQGRQIVTDEADDTALYIYGLRCAYCEGQIFHGGHIEHFRRKNPAHYPELTFEWTNLFIACGGNDHCGHFKDRGGAPYDPSELIKPDEHDADDYLYFHSSGEVRVRSRDNMSVQDFRRAEETIRVFHLNCGTLTGARHKALGQYLSKSTGILEALMDFDEDERKAFIAEEIEATKWQPFWTTIKHLFEKFAA